MLLNFDTGRRVLLKPKDVNISWIETWLGFEGSEAMSSVSKQIILQLRYQMVS